LYIAPLAVAAFGAWALLASQRATTQLDDLSEIDGVLRDYSFVHSNSEFVAALSIDGQPGRFWSPAAPMRKEPPPFARGSRVRLSINPSSLFRPLDGDARKAYGLWVDGRTVQLTQSVWLDAVIAEIPESD
jgi:hypothetical protein